MLRDKVVPAVRRRGGAPSDEKELCFLAEVARGAASVGSTGCRPRTSGDSRARLCRPREPTAVAGSVP